MTISPKGTIKYPQFINELSIYLGKLRDLYNSEMNEKNARFKRGDRSEQVNILGIRGELIAQYHFWKQGIPFEGVKLLSDKPMIACDIKTANASIDVKTIRSDAPDLLVNKEAHEKEKGITHYLFIQQIKEDEALYWLYTYESVSGWPYKNCVYSDAYYKELKTIKDEGEKL